MGRLTWEKPSVTIRTEFYKPEKGRYLHPQWEPGEDGHRVDRPITHLEAARLQSFPDSFEWCGSKIEVARQIGNRLIEWRILAALADLEAALRLHPEREPVESWPPPSTSRSATSSPRRSSTSRSPPTTTTRRYRDWPRSSTPRRSKSAITR